MFKKILLASAVLAATTGVAIANPAPYVGAGLGINTNTANNVAGSYRGVPFNVFAGYGGVLDQSFYLAGEVSGTVGTAEVANNGTVKTTYGYGASVLPGVMLSDHTLAFARAGVVRTHFSNFSNHMQTGGQFGLGLQTGLTQNVDLRGEYDFTAYRSSGSNPAARSDAATASLVYKFD